MMRVLISGAGVAGPTLAYFLARNGFEVTIVERSRGLRSSGAPVDVRGPALPVAERMGIMAQLRAAATIATRLSFVDDDGRRVGGMRLNKSGKEVELPRGELATILYEASRNDAEFLFDDSITGLVQDEAGVDVTFDNASQRRFDLVIGADGLHSTVRRLAFGPESDFVRHTGMFIATMTVPDWDGDPTEVVMRNYPGRAVAIHPSRGKALAAYMFRAPMAPGFDHRDTESHWHMLVTHFGRMERGGDLYLDSVSRVRLPQWSRGRVALLGDAASCVSLFGDGSSSAMAGAATLASALSDGGGFARYEATHRRIVDPKQRNMFLATSFLVPSTRAGLALRNFGAKLLAYGHKETSVRP